MPTTEQPPSKRGHQRAASARREPARGREGAQRPPAAVRKSRPFSHMFCCDWLPGAATPFRHQNGKSLPSVHWELPFCFSHHFMAGRCRCLALRLAGCCSTHVGCGLPLIGSLLPLDQEVLRYGNIRVHLQYLQYGSRYIKECTIMYIFYLFIHRYTSLYRYICLHVYLCIGVCVYICFYMNMPLYRNEIKYIHVCKSIGMK